MREMSNFFIDAITKSAPKPVEPKIPSFSDTVVYSNKIFLGAVFRDLEQFLPVLEAWKKTTNSDYTIKNGPKVKDETRVVDHHYYVFQCVFGGNHSRTRSSFTFLDCKACIRLTFKERKKLLEITILDTSHNHELHPHKFRENGRVMTPPHDYVPPPKKQGKAFNKNFNAGPQGISAQQNYGYTPYMNYYNPMTAQLPWTFPSQFLPQNQAKMATSSIPVPVPAATMPTDNSSPNTDWMLWYYYWQHCVQAAQSTGSDNTLFADIMKKLLSSDLKERAETTTLLQTCARLAESLQSNDGHESFRSMMPSLYFPTNNNYPNNK